MWWGSPPEEKDHGVDSMSENMPVTPVLVPSQSIINPAQQAGPVPVMVPDVNNLKEQFQQQQNMLTQIKETLKQNESQLSSKEKQAEAYANKLTQIKARSKNTQGKNSGSVSQAAKSLTKKSSKENLAKPDTSDPGKSPKIATKGKMNELKKCLEENKVKFEQRTGKELSETKKIESMVEQLKAQLQERDVVISDLQKNIEQPVSKSKADTLPRRSKHKTEGLSSKATQTLQTIGTEKSIEVITLENQVYQLEATVIDLQETLKEKESIIQARTQAVTLLTEDLNKKGKNTLDDLEDTRQEMRSMQNNFVDIENQLKAQLEDRDDKITHFEDKFKKLETVNFELSLKNAEQQEKLVNLQTKYMELEQEKKSLQETAAHVEADSGIDELNKKIDNLKRELDESNKLMIKMKLEHKNKIRNLNKTLEKLKEGSDDKTEILKLTNKVEELESIREKLENKVAELEEEKVSESKLKDQINELESRLKLQSEDLDSHLRVITTLESDKLDLMQSNQDQNILIENLYEKIGAFESDNVTKSESESSLKAKIEELNLELVKLDNEYKEKIEAIKLDHGKEIEMLEFYYNSKAEGTDRKEELEEYRISNELNNIHVEEQIELLIREKQQLLEKLKNLSGVSSTDSLTFEKMEHSELKEDKEATPVQSFGTETSPEEADPETEGEQQTLIKNLQDAINEEKQKVSDYQAKVSELEEIIKNIEDVNNKYKDQIENSDGNQKSNVNSKNKLRKLEKELAENKRIVKEQNGRIEEMKEKMEENEKLINEHLEKIKSLEQDDWGRDDWKIATDEFDTVQELQKKCLGLENNLIELNEDCERLRKENIEFVHLLSEEKVKRKKLEEMIDEATMTPREAEDPGLEERVQNLFKVNQELEGKVQRLEIEQANRSAEMSDEKIRAVEEANKDLQDQLERLNIVLTGKETEIFRLESLLENHLRSIENLQRDYKEAQDQLAEKNEKLNDILEELNLKERQLEDISVKSEQLRESVELANQRTAKNETQLRELLETVKEMEKDVSKKEDELQEIKGLLAEKNLDMTNLRKRLEEVNSDLTYNYQEHLENMGKCLRDKEAEFDELLAEKSRLEEIYHQCVSEKDEIYNQKMELLVKCNELTEILEEKEKTIQQLNEKAVTNVAQKSKSEEVEELKTKLKKVAANLKRKVQNEKDLLKALGEKDAIISEKNQEIEKLQEDAKEVTEKWTLEKSEKEQLRCEISEAWEKISFFETTNASLTEKVSYLETELTNLQQTRAIEGQESEAQIRKISEESLVNREHDKNMILDWEKKFTHATEIYESLNDVSKRQLVELEEQKRINEELNQKLTIVVGKFQEEKSIWSGRFEEIEKDFEEVKSFNDNLNSEKLELFAKLQENLAVIENLELQSAEVQNRLERSEESTKISEEQRFLLENQNLELAERLNQREEVLKELENRLDKLLNGEAQLRKMVEEAEAEKREIFAALSEARDENASLKNEVEALKGKLASVSDELKNREEADWNQNENVEYLSRKLNDLANDNKTKSAEIDELRKNVNNLEQDLAESERIIKSYEGDVKQLKSEIFDFSEKFDLLTAEKTQLESKLKEESVSEEKPKKRKSVTFRTDELEYIKELKNQIQNYDATLKQANEEVEGLKMELFKAKLRNEVLEVVAEAEEKAESIKSDSPKAAETPTESGDRKFDANVFFGGGSEPHFDGNSFFDQQLDGLGVQNAEQSDPTTDFDSLVWDDGWGTDGQLEEQYMSAKAEKTEKAPEAVKNEYEEKCKRLEKEMREIEIEKENILEELRVTQAKYSKVVRKVKEQKVVADRLQSELNKMKKNGSFAELDDAIIDELKSQVKDFENRIAEMTKEMENSKLERESLLKRIEVLSAGNDKFLEMKERQDNNAQLWEQRNKELLREMSELRERLNSSSPVDENELVRENKQLKNQVEGLEWEICELKEVLEEKQEIMEARGNEASFDYQKAMEEKSVLQKELDELTEVRERLEREILEEGKRNSETIEELQEQVTALAAENDSLQDILGEMKKNQANRLSPAPPPPPLAQEFIPAVESSFQASKMFDYFKSSEDVDILSGGSQYPGENVTELEERLKTATDELIMLKREKEIWGVTERELLANYENLHQNSQLQQSEAAQFRDEVAYLRKEVEGSHLNIYNIRNENEEESNSLKQRIKDLEVILVLKEEEIQTLLVRLEELEKSYNDSKLEIERLLNEEKLSTEEAFQQNALEQVIESLKLEKVDLEDALLKQKEEIYRLGSRLNEYENRLTQSLDEENRQKLISEENSFQRRQLDGTVKNLQQEIESLRFELSAARRTAEVGQNSNYELVENLKSQIKELERELLESSEKNESEIKELKLELEEVGKQYGVMMTEKNSECAYNQEILKGMSSSTKELEAQVETLKSELLEKENDMQEISQIMEEERKQLAELRALLDDREREIDDLKQTLGELHKEITSFRNFEKQMKELRMSQQGGAPEMNPAAEVVASKADGIEVPDWSEHEATELSARLQSDLDTALYMLHQRDVRCDELTFELMQLLQERDMLQLRLSTAIRINEDLRTQIGGGATSSSSSSSNVNPDVQQESKDLVDQSNDRQEEKSAHIPKEDLRQLADKLSELHNVGYVRDKTIQDDTVQRHREQMTLLGRISDTDLSLTRDVQNPPTVLLNWIRGKTTPKVMHI